MHRPDATTVDERPHPKGEIRIGIAFHEDLRDRSPRLYQGCTVGAIPSRRFALVVPYYGSSRKATEAIGKLRLGIDQAPRAMRDLTQVGGDWGHGLQERARDVAKELRSRGDRAVGTVSWQVPGRRAW